MVPIEVLEAFGAREEPVRLSDEKGAVYRAGHLVFKPAPDVREAVWAAKVFESIKQEGFRVAAPQPTLKGERVFNGWQAWEFLEGKEDKERWKEKVAVSRAFHRALVGIPDPGWLRTLKHPWAVADRMAWGEEAQDLDDKVAEPVWQLKEVLRPVDLPSQVIHGDLGAGNILFARKKPPAVIDFSPYWRPAGFALAVGVVDMMAWEKADKSILKEVADEPGIDQLLVRALLRRILELDQHWKQRRIDAFSDIQSYQPVIDLVCRRIK